MPALKLGACTAWPAVDRPSEVSIAHLSAIHLLVVSSMKWVCWPAIVYLVTYYYTVGAVWHY